MQSRISLLVIIFTIHIFCCGQTLKEGVWVDEDTSHELEVKAERCLDQYFQDHNADLQELKSLFEKYFCSHRISNPADPLVQQYEDILRYLAQPYKEIPVFDEQTDVMEIKDKFGLSNTEIAIKLPLSCYLDIFQENIKVLDTALAFYKFGLIIGVYAEIPEISPGLAANVILSGIQRPDLSKELYQKVIVLLYCFEASFPLENFESDDLDVPNTVIPIYKSDGSDNFIPVEPRNDPLAENADNNIFGEVDQMPGFPGGWAGLYQYISENLKYPQKAFRKKIEGKVYVTFIIDSDGSVESVQTLNSLGGGCDEEAIRVIENMPKWTPGIKDGKAVRVQYNLPIRFTLSKR